MEGFQGGLVGEALGEFSAEQFQKWICFCYDGFMKLKLLSWNIWGGTYREEIIEFLRAADVDIIALQEVIEDENGNTAMTIAKEFGYEFVSALDMKMSSRWSGPRREKEEIINFGNAVLVKPRYKIVSSEAIEMSASESRVAIRADIKIEGVILHVFSIHLKHDHPKKSDPKNVALQKEQTDKLVSIMPLEKVVVMGDMNNIPGSYAVDTMSKVLQNAGEHSNVPTWSVYPDTCDICPLNGVEYKFDYIFTSKDIKTDSFEVGQSKGADHLPVSAVIEI